MATNCATLLCEVVKQVNMPYHIELLVCLANSRIISKSDLISRIDSIILSCDNLPFELIDASLSSSKRIEDICGHLKEYTSKHKIDYDALKRQVMRELFKRYKEGNLPLEQAIHCLYLMSMTFPFLDEAEQNELYVLSDVFYLAEEGIYSDLFEVKERFEQLMSSYITP